MSLLTTVNGGSPGLKYFIENIGGPGLTAADAPCIKGSTNGAVRIGDPADGVIIRGDLLGANNAIRGGQAAGGVLTIGNSSASLNNIAMGDGITVVNGILTTNGAVVASGPLTVNGALTATAGLSVSGDITLLSGFAGDSISGYYVSSSPFTSAGGVIANPAGLTSGLYSVIVLPSTSAGNEAAEASAVCYYTGTAWFGNGVSFNFTAGEPNVAIGPASGSATLTLGGVGIPATGNIIFRKLLNAA